MSLNQGLSGNSKTRAAPKRREDFAKRRQRAARTILKLIEGFRVEVGSMV